LVFKSHQYLGRLGPAGLLVVRHAAMHSLSEPGAVLSLISAMAILLRRAFVLFRLAKNFQVCYHKDLLTPLSLKTLRVHTGMKKTKKSRINPHGNLRGMTNASRNSIPRHARHKLERLDANGIPVD